MDTRAAAAEQVEGVEGAEGGTLVMSGVANKPLGGVVGLSHPCNNQQNICFNQLKEKTHLFYNHWKHESRFTKTTKQR